MKYSCGQEFTYTHHKPKYFDNFRFLNDFFELFFFQGAMIVKETALKTWIKQELGEQVWIYLGFSVIHAELKVHIAA